MKATDDKIVLTPFSWRFAPTCFFLTTLFLGLAVVSHSLGDARTQSSLPIFLMFAAFFAYQTYRGLFLEFAFFENGNIFVEQRLVWGTLITSKHVALEKVTGVSKLKTRKVSGGKRRRPLYRVSVDAGQEHLAVAYLYFEQDAAKAVAKLYALLEAEKSSQVSETKP